MIAAIPSAVILGVEGRPVFVEVHVSNGLPGFTVVGLPDASVRESRDRVRAALLSSGLPWPQRRVTVNLAPSGVRKGGAGLDLPIAIGVLVASGAVPASAVRNLAFCGELGLDGSIRAVPGAMALTETVMPCAVVLPRQMAAEAALVEEATVRTAGTLAELVDQLGGRRPWPVVPAPGRLSAAGGMPHDGEDGAAPDLTDVRGQRFARLALEVAAAGGHHMLLVGPPGSGKTMLAVRLPGLLPDLDRDRAIQVSRIRSAAGLPLGCGGLVVRPPFRSPHHGASLVTMIGGGGPWPRPGEISLAHGGVLFLDEFGEFSVPVLEALRQPLEDGVIRISRARGSVDYPARFLMIAAMNPCPCGVGGPPGSCRCSRSARSRYARRVSAPLLDRFDIAIRLDRPDPDELVGDAPLEGTAAASGRVRAARARARQRGVTANAELSESGLARFARLSPPVAAPLERRIRKGGLTARGYRRVHRLARTLADLQGAAEIEEWHVLQALLLRNDQSVLLGEAADD